MKPPTSALSGTSGWERTFWTSSPRAATWSAMTGKGCQEASMPAEAPTFSRSSASVLLATAQRVWGTTRTRSTFSRWTPRTRASSACGVTRPPGLRKILASPGLSPSIPRGSMRESMQVTIATPAWATPSKPARSKEAANSWLAASRSSKLTSGTLANPSTGGAEQVAGRDGPRRREPEEHEGEHGGDERTHRGTREDRLLLGDPGDLEQPR